MQSTMQPQFSPNQIQQLQRPLVTDHILKNPRGFDYLPGWHVIDSANKIFGFDGWQQQLHALDLVLQEERKIGKAQKPGWKVTYRCHVVVTAGGCRRDGVGFGFGTMGDLGEAHESAAKEAHTDAIKRALIQFGYQFGLALYDKEQANVESPEDKFRRELPQLAQAANLTPFGYQCLLYQLGQAKDAYDLSELLLQIAAQILKMPEKVESLNNGKHTKTGDLLFSQPSALTLTVPDGTVANPAESDDDDERPAPTTDPKAIAEARRIQEQGRVNM